MRSTFLSPATGVCLAALGATLALAACGGGGGSSPAPMPVTTQPGTVSPSGQTLLSVTITWPAATTSSSSARRPAYISPSIQSLQITIDGANPVVYNAPTPTGSPQTITETAIPVAPGAHAFVVTEYDKTAAAGSLLGQVTTNQSITAGILNQLNFTVNGELAKIVVQAPTSPFIEGTSANGQLVVSGGLTFVGNQAFPFTAVPEDADGNIIVTPGLVPTLTATSATPATIVATSTGTNTFTLAAPAPTTAAVPITVSGTDLFGKTVSTVFPVQALAAFYIADFTVQKIRVFDENGVPLTLASTAFPLLSNPMGLAYVPTSTGIGGNVVVTETANFSAPYVLEFDENGNATTLGSGTYTGVSQPLFLTYGGGQIFVPNYYNSSVSVFDPTGNPVTLASTAFGQPRTTATPLPAGQLAQPVSIAYDTNNKQVYVTNTADNMLTTYTAAGATVGAVTTTTGTPANAGSHPMGITYDSANKAFYVASGGDIGDTLDMGNPILASIQEFSETPALVANNGGFQNTSMTAFFTGIAADPYKRQIYVSDAGDSSILAFTEAGAAVTLPTGAFSTINATTSPKADPMAILLVP